jgi:PAS domain S-box-containing protein
MLDNVPVGVAIGDTAGTIREANHELVRMLRYDDPSELIGLTFPQISHPEDAGTLTLVLEHVASRADGRIQFEKRYLRRDGEPLWVRVTVAPVAAESDLIVSVIEDLSEKRAFEEQLRQAQKLEAIGLLAGGIAHDFNNLLMVIGGYASMLVGSEALPESARLYASEIMGAYTRGADLTQQLLAFSRRTQLNTRVLSLNDSVREMRGLLARLVGEPVTLDLDLQPELGAIEADESQLGQVLMNLAANARDAMPDGGVLRLATSNRSLDAAEADQLKVAPGDYVELAVSDSGEGMDERTQAHIFEPFFTTKPQGKGTGLGLAVSYGIVSQSGGTIELESTLGAGTTFRILLPRTEATSIGEPVAPREKPGALAARVLLVEDDEQVRVLTRQMLEQLGCTVHDAATPEEALALARDLRWQIDVLVTDVVMPGLNGPALAEELAADRADLPVLYVSGYPASALSGRRSELGSAYLTKPYTREQLKMALVNLIGRRMSAPAVPVARGDSV